MSTTVFDRRPPSARAVARRTLDDAALCVLARRRRAPPASAPPRRGASRPRHRRRRLRGSLDRRPRQGARPGAPRGARGGGGHRVGRVRPQRRLLRGEHHARPRERRHPLADEIDQLERLGAENLDDIEATVARYGMDVDFERTGALSVATEPHQVEWLREEEGFLDADAVRAEVDSPTYLAGRVGQALERARASGQARPRARARGHGARRRDLRALPRARPRRDGPRVGAHGARPHPRARRRAGDQRLPVAAEAQPAHDRAGLRLRADDASPSMRGSWRASAGRTDRASATRRTSSTTTGSRPRTGSCSAGTMPCYHYGGRVRSRYEDRPETYRTLAEHFFTTFPQLEGLRFTHRWAGAIDTCTPLLRVLRHRPRGPGGVCRRVHRARCRRHPVRRRRDARSARGARPRNAPNSRWCGDARCRSRPSRRLRSGSTSPVARSTAPTATGAVATCC